MANKNESSSVEPIDAWRENDKIKNAIFVSLALLLGMFLMKKASAYMSTPSISAETEQIAICSDASNIKVWAGQSKRIHIQPDCWSGKIATELNKEYHISAPGEHEVCFWTDRGCLKTQNINDNDPAWSGDIPVSAFRLKGKDGTAIITVAK